jgi:hypothetical protein
MILFKVLPKKFCERRSFTISELSCEFPQILRNVSCVIITVWLSYHNFLRMMGSENAQGCAQNAENGLGFDIFGAMPQRWL